MSVTQEKRQKRFVRIINVIADPQAPLRVNPHSTPSHPSSQSDTQYQRDVSEPVCSAFVHIQNEWPGCRSYRTDRQMSFQIRKQHQRSGEGENKENSIEGAFQKIYFFYSMTRSIHLIYLFVYASYVSLRIDGYVGEDYYVNSWSFCCIVSCCSPVESLPDDHLQSCLSLLDSLSHSARAMVVDQIEILAHNLIHNYLTHILFSSSIFFLKWLS